MKRSTTDTSRLNRPANKSSFSLAISIFILTFGIIGVYVFTTSNASTPTTQLETENGTIIGNARNIFDASASNSQAVQFNSSTTDLTMHYTANIGNDQTTAALLGYNLFDVGPTEALINGLPTGVLGLVWLGNMDNAPVGSSCPAPSLTDSQFQADVDSLASNPKVFGFYISDEPHPIVCPNAAIDLKTRSDYIHAHAPGKKVFIVVLDGSNVCPNGAGCEYSALQPSKTGADYIGLDPYPCHFAADGVATVPCDSSVITTKANLAISNGIPANTIVPTFQTFGQSGRTDGKSVYYRMPSPTELTSMINAWASIVPHPAFDYSYSFGVQCGSSCPATQAIINTPSIQTILKNHNQ